MNIKNIKKEFQENPNVDITKCETILFSAFAEAILNNSNSTFIHETHGNVAKVNFFSKINKRQEQCEIADLLIISRRTVNKEFRATFWQAKRKKSSSRSTGKFKFLAQLNQWELLAHRPEIWGATKSFDPPRDLLQNPRSPSIGSFGVFHQESGKVEVNYSVAELVQLVKPSSTAKHPTMFINESLSQTNAWAGETQVNTNILEFLGDLSNFKIGSIFDPNRSSDKCLAKYVTKKCIANNINDFMDVTLPSLNGSVPDEEIRDGLSLLLIDID